MKNKIGTLLLKLAIGCWLLVTFAALAGMYQLWWQRERVLYLGKNTAEQRRTVFQRAGLPPVLADKTAELERQWPADLRYKARGDDNSLSYIQYLLIPRIPVNEAEHVLEVNGSNLKTSDPHIGQVENTPSETASSPKGLILSFAVLLGWAVLLRKMWKGRATWPKAIALACLFFTLLALPTRFFFFSMKPAFGGAIILALVGWTAYRRSFCVCAQCAVDRLLGLRRGTVLADDYLRLGRVSALSARKPPRRCRAGRPFRCGRSFDQK